MLYRVHLAWAGCELTTLVVIDTDCSQPMETSNSIDFWQVKEVADGILQYLGQVCGFLWVLRFPLPIKLYQDDITEILLKVVLNTIKPTNQTYVPMTATLKVF
jgi:hypothetical protein